MPAIPQAAKAEAATSAVFEKQTRPQPEKTPAQERASRYREILNNNGSHELFKHFAERRKPVEGGRVSELTKNNTSIRGERNEAQQRRFNEAQRLNNMYETFIQRGYAGLNPAQREALAQNVGELMIAASPALQERLKELGQLRFNQEIVAPHLQDPEFLNKMRGKYEEATDQSNLIEDKVSEARIKANAARSSEERSEIELRRNAGEKSLASEKLDEFADRSDVGGEKGRLAQELEEITRELPELEERRAELEEQLNRAQLSLNRLVIDRRLQQMGREIDLSIEDDILQTDGNITQIQRDIKSVDKRIQRKSDLEEQKAHLMRRRGELEVEGLELQRGKDEVTRERSLADIEHDSTLTGRETSEEQFMDGLRNVPTEAAINYFQDRITAVQQGQEEIDQKEMTEAQDKGEKALIIGNQKRHGRGKGRYVKTRTGLGPFAKEKEEFHLGKLPKETIEQDFRTLMEDGPNKNLIRKTLASAVDEEGNRVMTDAEIEDRLQDEKFVSNASLQIAEKVLRAKLEVGQLSENEAKYIGETEWGANIITEASANNEEIKAHLEALQEQTGSKNLRETLAKMSTKDILALILMILGSAAFSAIQSVNLKEAIGQQA